MHFTLLVCLSYTDDVNSASIQVTVPLPIVFLGGVVCLVFFLFGVVCFFFNVEKLGRVLGKGTKMTKAQEHKIVKQFKS